MNRNPVLTLAKNRFPRGGWVLVEGHHGELFVVSARSDRVDAWDRSQATAIVTELAADEAVQLSHVRAPSARLEHCTRAYVAVEADEGGWVVADAFVRFDDDDTLPFDPPGSNI